MCEFNLKLVTNFETNAKIVRSSADQIVACVIMYLKMVNRNNPVISQL